MPVCDVALQSWQGKDGPCELLVWQQGHGAPIDQECDPQWRAPDLGVFRLPATFWIRSTE
ncbi:MAG: hypothetical protein ACM31C_04930 [Acidobacteriota bacterium]